MESIRRGLARLPMWLLSIVTLLVILWLTLSPKPLGETPPPLFPGADKLAHGIMFGGFTLVMLLDWQRKHHWKEVWWSRALLYATISSIIGIFIEFAQGSMNLGRSFEYEDIFADTIGAFVFAVFYKLLQKTWLPVS